MVCSIFRLPGHSAELPNLILQDKAVVRMSTLPNRELHMPTHQIDKKKLHRPRIQEPSILLVRVLNNKEINVNIGNYKNDRLDIVNFTRQLMILN